ncbi:MULTISPECIES: ATP-binding cassette domain-containing protein [unclassified Brevibacterium]|uniref:ATP-binding cassette domain-containing protein n=1 Tax=unclassified Brevibacterium TaxID=2614124 RepID=UPI001E34227C|nr:MULTISPECIES: ATP-binding cassette domain-containing protein [unclassified Brevibacterium]MCD1287567.1 daunorubicin/doxorubicin resistance ABC transporter ATP-binding protein DrrA [Brevibacterium sp. CCUG 69071]MDK8436625.1 ATP-binding cassette domain-containing protein [Brevibacterium sp. H-BE7]
MIRLENLRKNYGAFRALDGISLDIEEGQIFGLLGPNGAGKTTTVKVLSTLIRPDSGTALVAGHSVTADPTAVRRSIGLSGQYAAVDEKLTGYENLVMVARLYGMSRRNSAARARELLAEFGLSDVAGKRAGAYSGGMRRRLDLASALVVRPPVVILDEPTTGLDPRARLDTWEVITTLVRGGTTVLLTTQYLEEADQLADRIAVIDSGHVIAEGTATDLKGKLGAERITLTLTHPDSREGTLRILDRIIGESARPQTDSSGLRITASAPLGQRNLLQVLAALDEEGHSVTEAALCRPTLDDVFLELTGQPTSAEPVQTPAETAEVGS